MVPETSQSSQVLINYNHWKKKLTGILVRKKKHWSVLSVFNQTRFFNPGLIKEIGPGKRIQNSSVHEDSMRDLPAFKQTVIQDEYKVSDKPVYNTFLGCLIDQGRIFKENELDFFSIG